MFATDFSKATMFFSSKKEIKYLFFILMEDLPISDRVFPAGHIAVIAETDYLKEMQNEPQAPGRKLKFHLLEADVHLQLEVDSLRQLNEQDAGLLLAVSPSSQRFSLYLEKEALENALQIQYGNKVTVDYKSKQLPGVVRYIGSICDNPKLSGTFFGIELQVEGAVDDLCDGTFAGHQYFICKKGCGVFVPFTKVKRRWSFGEGEQCASAGGVKTNTTGGDHPVNPGDRVAVYMEEEMKGGTVMGVMDGGSTVLVNFESDKMNGEEAKKPFRVPMDSVIKEDMLQSMGSIQLSNSRDISVDGGWSPEGLKGDPMENGASRSDRFLGVKSLVQINMGNVLMTGVIQWMGHVPGMKGKIAGVELDEDKGQSDGTWMGHRYFQCAPKRGIFVRMASCQPDTRFQSLAVTPEDSQGPARTANRESCVVPVIVPPPRNEEAVRILLGRMRGIQGHCNSCYMDSALFSLFSCTLVLDSMLHKSTNQFSHIQRILREEIVNPLRRDGFVDCKKVMNLRKELTQGGYCAGFTTEEKDPEEFLSVIMQQVLGLEPLLKLRSAGQKEQECYCHQIFIDKDDDLIVPTVQQLVEHSFHSNHLKLAEVPSCFIIQMPRFGKNYKMFEKIIPSLELDITDLLSDSPRECCLCGELAIQECEECFTDKLFSKTGLKQYCGTCWHQVHSHSSRRDHRPMKLDCPEGFVRTGKAMVPRERMQLFAMLCIETSHYVSFIKYGPEEHQWMFFDSMSDRHGEGYRVERRDRR
ncbi:ubiquitin carboxyl-terminal hydrolase CYLD isoform X2 [Mustelus asterias]